MTRGLALVLAVMLAGLAHFAELSAPVPRPATIATCDRFRSAVTALVLPAGDRLLHGCLADGTFLTWNPRFSSARAAATPGLQPIGAAFAADGSRLAVIDSRRVVSLWDVATRRRWAEIPSRGGVNWALALSRDGTTLATADRSGVRLWDLTAANPGAGPRLDLDGVTGLAFAADGRTLAVGAFDGTVRLWDPAQGTQGTRFRAHRPHVKTLVFSEDGRVLATSSPEAAIARLWDVGTGRLLKELDARSPIQILAFSPGGGELATAGLDGAVRLWDVATGEERWVLSEQDGPVSTLAISADGATMACGTMGMIRLYRLDMPSQTTSR